MGIYSGWTDAALQSALADAKAGLAAVASGSDAAAAYRQARNDIQTEMYLRLAPTALIVVGVIVLVFFGAKK